MHTHTHVSSIASPTADGMGANAQTVADGDMYASILMNERVFGGSVPSCSREPSSSLLSAALMLCKHRQAPLALISFIPSHLPSPPLSIFSIYLSLHLSLFLSLSLAFSPIQNGYLSKYSISFVIHFLLSSFLLSPPFLLFSFQDLSDEINMSCQSFSNSNAIGHYNSIWFILFSQAFLPIFTIMFQN